MEILLPLLVGYVAGVVLLTLGAEALVRGGVRLGAVIGISPIVIGLTVVSIGTSAPEFAVSLDAVFFGQSDITVGNILGSNLANILLIVGLCAVFIPLPIHLQLLRFDVPFMAFSSIAAFLLALDGRVSSFDGLLLVCCLVGYLVFLWVRAKWKGKVPEVDENQHLLKGGRAINLARGTALAFVGVVFLSYGADLFVGAAVETARLLEVSELLIGLTVVAVGTSLPEVVTSVVATVKGQRDIAVGNVVGSCIFNVLFVLGASALIQPIVVSASALHLDFPVTCAVSFFCIPIFLSGMRVDRVEGIFFLAGYTAYLLYLSLSEMESRYLATFESGIVYGFIPLLLLLAPLTFSRGYQRWSGPKIRG